MPRSANRLPPGVGLCSVCGGKAAGVPFMDHGKCPECLEAALSQVRQSGKCCRCGSDVAPFRTHREHEIETRHLFCSRCGLVLFRREDDRIKGLGMEL